jgi:beta-galactosidase/beta-glucuronidase
VNTEFFKPGFNDKSWANFQVPSNGEMHVFGDPLFRNAAQPFKANPPFVPHEYYPTGSYQRDFMLPKNWNDKNIILRMEKQLQPYLYGLMAKKSVITKECRDLPNTISQNI